MAFITLPQNPVVAGQSGHLADHENAESAIAALWGAVQQSIHNVIAPPYGADPTGVTDATTAFQNAINAAQSAGGGIVSVPAGTFKLSTLTLNNGTTGYTNVRIIGAGTSSVLKKSGNGTLIAMSGPASDTTGATHCRVCSLESLTIDGGGFTGLLVQSYYADNLMFRDVHFQNNNDVCHDTAELWDTRFYNCVWDTCGSTTANTTAPNVWLRSSANTVGNFGYSTDVLNQVYFHGCRWESFRTGAVRIERGPGGGSSQPNAAYMVDCKMETNFVNGGSHLFVDTPCRDINLKHCYFYSGGFYTGYSTAQDVISFSPQFGTLDDVLIFNASATACVANGVKVNSATSGRNVVLRNVHGSYTGGATPTGAHINFGTQTGGILVDNCTTDNGTLFAGTTPNAPAAGVNDVQTFTSSGTWTKPPGAVMVTVLLVGGGGGGGSGAVEASGTVASGGAGGGGGGYSLVTFPAALLSSTETVTVGAAGGGGTAVGTAASNGNAGGNGGTTSFKSVNFATAGGGGGGGGGTTSAATCPFAGGGSSVGGTGGSSSGTGGAGSGGNGSNQGAPGGGSGAGLATTPANAAGGAGGVNGVNGGLVGGSAGTSGGGGGGAGQSAGANFPSAGSGGGGGGSATAANGGAGGVGGNYGAGGGGGGATLTGHSSGAGGAGSAGIVVVITTTVT